MEYILAENREVSLKYRRYLLQCQPALAPSFSSSSWRRSRSYHAHSRLDTAACEVVALGEPFRNICLAPPVTENATTNIMTFYYNQEPERKWIVNE